jgi:hypothetical protein
MAAPHNMPIMKRAFGVDAGSLGSLVSMEVLLLFPDVLTHDVFFTHSAVHATCQTMGY